jgi:hypothetical protein
MTITVRHTRTGQAITYKPFSDYRDAKIGHTYRINHEEWEIIAIANHFQPEERKVTHAAN